MEKQWQIITLKVFVANYIYQCIYTGGGGGGDKE